jgi:hypothetical protein
MKKTLLSIFIVFLFSSSLFAQEYSIIDSVSNRGIFEAKIEARERFESSKGKIVNNLIKKFNGTKKSNKISVNATAISHAAIVYFIVTHPDYFTKEIDQDMILDNIIPLVKNGIRDEYCIKLFTVKKEISEAEKTKLKALFELEDIQKITRKDGRFAYITTPIKNLYKSIDKLEKLKASKNLMVQDSYLLYARSNMPVHFRIQLAVAHESMISEFNTPSKLLENRYKLKQMQTEDSLYRVVSSKKYTDYAEAVKDFSEKVRVRLGNPKAVIIACTKVGEKEKVITPMSL